MENIDNKEEIAELRSQLKSKNRLITTLVLVLLALVLFQIWPKQKLPTKLIETKKISLTENENQYFNVVRWIFNEDKAYDSLVVNPNGLGIYEPNLPYVLIGHAERKAELKVRIKLKNNDTLFLAVIDVETKAKPRPKKRIETIPTTPKATQVIDSSVVENTKDSSGTKNSTEKKELIEKPNDQKNADEPKPNDDKEEQLNF